MIDAVCCEKGHVAGTIIDTLSLTAFCQLGVVLPFGQLRNFCNLLFCPQRVAPQIGLMGETMAHQAGEQKHKYSNNLVFNFVCLNLSAGHQILEQILYMFAAPSLSN